jgi:hypothetical protein
MTRKYLLIAVLLIISIVSNGFAQEMKGMPMPSKSRADTTTKKKPGKKPATHTKMPTHEMKGLNIRSGKGNEDTTKNGQHESMNMDHTDSHDMENMEMAGMNSMPHAYSLNLPMNRNGSGTGWLPDASPMYGYMFHKDKWMYMLHGNLFLRYNIQDVTHAGTRGASKVDIPDWLMFMGQRPVGTNGLFHFSTMFSLDALTGGNGYPLLFQSGEAYNGKPIVDRQHPHDLFSELSVSYAHALSRKTDIFVYVGYPGEPALGPVAFMHRPSALANPDAPLSHHWVDATHITFGVATFGMRFGDLKIEGSSFTGREPDDNRYDFDKPRFDSWSGRLSYNPSANWALQVSHGFIKSPELLHPLEDIHRTTASAIFSKEFQGDGIFNSTIIWGLNKSAGHSGEHAVLVEPEWRKNKLSLFSRYEWVQKSTEELDLNAAVYGQDAVLPVNALTVGANYDLLSIGKTRLAAGGQFTFYHAPSKLDGLYGKNPVAMEIYLRLYPSQMMMNMKH